MQIASDRPRPAPVSKIEAARRRVDVALKRVDTCDTDTSAIRALLFDAKAWGAKAVADIDDYIAFQTEPWWADDARQVLQDALDLESMLH